MNVILLEKMGHLGDLGEQVSVKPGYARNYLIPQHKAVPATKVNVELFESRRAELEKVAAAKLKVAQERATALSSLAITIKARAADEGKLYGSIGTHEIATAITQAGVEIHKSEIRLPHGALRELGEYEIAVQLHGDVKAVVKVAVIAEA